MHFFRQQLGRHVEKSLWTVCVIVQMTQNLQHEHLLYTYNFRLLETFWNNKKGRALF